MRQCLQMTTPLLEQVECYICLEPCTNEKSPCRCQIPVHYTCLSKAIVQLSTQCTVCKSNIKLEESHTETEESPSTQAPSTPATKESISFLNMIGLVVIMMLSAWVLGGYLGNWVLTICGRDTNTIWSFWSIQHFFGFSLILVFLLFVGIVYSVSVKLCRTTIR